MARSSAELLHDAGHEVVVIAGAMESTLTRELDSNLHGAASFTQDEGALGASVTTTDHDSFLRAFRRWFDSQLDHYDIELLHVHNCGRIFDQVDLAELSQRIPVMHTMHDEWFFTDAHYTFCSRTGDTIRTYEPRNDSSVVEHDYGQLFAVPERAGDFLGIGPSQWITDRAARVFPRLDMVHIPNGVDPNMFSLQDRAAARDTLGLPADRPVVLFIGNPTQERKGFHIYEAAVSMLQRGHTAAPIRLVVGGSGSVATGGIESELVDGPITERLRHSTTNPVKDLGLDGPALVVADLDRSLLATVYGAADVLVHPSLIDNLPTVPIEAGLCGTRCLATNVGGTAEVIADVDDLFPLDIAPGELAARITDALREAASETATDRLARRETQLARFAPEKHRDALLSVVDRLVRSAGSHG